MGRSIAITLIAAILSCPLLCAGGASGARSSSKGAGKHCSCCHDDRSTDGRDSRHQDRRGSHSGHSCQCICGGAVVDDAGIVVIAFDWDWSVPLVPVAVVAAQLQDFGIQQVSLAPWPDVGMNHGRALCCLFNTYLC